MHADPGGFVVAFGAGIASFLSPCVLPLVPGYVSLVAGVRAGDQPGSGGGREVTRGALVRAIALFVAGFTVVFVALGASATALGTTLVRNQRVLEIAAGAVTVAVGVLFSSGTSPRLLGVERRFHASPSALGRWAPPVMGMAFAFGWTPCIGPVLGAVLAQAASRSTVTGGIVLLCAYSIGLGVPFVAAGVAWDRVCGALGWLRRHTRAVQGVAGGVLVVWGVLMLAGRVTVVAGWISTVLRDLGLARLAVS